MPAMWICCDCGGDNLLLYEAICLDCTHSKCRNCPLSEIGSIDPEASQYLVPPSEDKSRPDVSGSRDQDRAPDTKSKPTILEWLQQLRYGASGFLNRNKSQHMPKNTPSNIKSTESVKSDYHTTHSQYKEHSEYSDIFEQSSTEDLINLTTLKDSGPFTFPLDSALDSQLLKKWHSSILPAISSPQMGWKFNTMSSLPISRRGYSLEQSTPTIIVTYVGPTNDMSMWRILRAVSSLFDARKRWLLRIVFEEARLRRSTEDDPKYPPICEPQNIEGERFPTFGSSIGIRGLDDSLATLGGYLVIDGDTFLLTVDHLVPNDGQPIESIFITHPSQQEQLIRPWGYNVGQCIRDLGNCCASCSVLGDAADINYNHAIFDMKELYIPIYHTYIAAQNYQRAYQDFARALPKPLGRLQARSGLRSRMYVAGQDGVELYGVEKRNVEMDWALFRVDEWPMPMDPYARIISDGLSSSVVVPGAWMYATGRTSGRQEGVINPAKVVINHGDRFTIEWSISPDPGTSLDSWVVGGIGVDGDSGSWIFDRKDRKVYGMVWGRHGPLTDPITLSTPMGHIFADIREQTGAKDVCLPSHIQENMLPGKGKVKEVILPMLQSSSQSTYDEKASISAAAMPVVDHISILKHLEI